MLKKIWEHFKLITKHKFLVLKFSIKAGNYWRGIVHDLSKYSPIEFIESAKFYNGSRSPIVFARKEYGYSKAWLHHVGRNKHHEEYWYDWYAEEKAPVIPYKYVVEMICDQLAAGKVYCGKEWNQEYPLKYFNERKIKSIFNPKTLDFIESVLTQIKDEGIDKTLIKDNLKEKYNKYCK